MPLTSHERLLRIFQNREIDRPAIKLWGVQANWRNTAPAYHRISRLAAELSDIFVSVGSRLNPIGGTLLDSITERWTEDLPNPLWKSLHTVYHTPLGDLHMAEHVSTVGEPGYITEHFIKEPEDIQKILSIPFEAPDVSRDEYDKLSAYLGDRGLVSFQIPHAAYQVHILTGSETLALMSFDCREPLLELTRVFAERIYNYVEKILDLGIQAPIAWVGPEVFIPPLMSPKDFQDFVYNFDKPICDLIHLRESYVWVHCHGKVANYLDSFIDMGVDVLNPLEPPKNGDIHLGDAVKKYGNRIGWEGNIEIQDILLASPDELRNLIDTCVDQGAPSGRFILCNSAGFDEYPVPTESYLDNLELYLRHGYEAVNRYSR